MAIEPVKGDPSTEPVATAQQSHRAGRVGPPTIAQDAAAPWYKPDGVTQIEPGEEASADLAMEGGALPEDYNATDAGLEAAEEEAKDAPQNEAKSPNSVERGSAPGGRAAAKPRGEAKSA